MQSTQFRGLGYIQKNIFVGIPKKRILTYFSLALNPPTPPPWFFPGINSRVCVRVVYIIRFQNNRRNCRCSTVQCSTEGIAVYSYVPQTLENRVWCVIIAMWQLQCNNCENYVPCRRENICSGIIVQKIIIATKGD